MGRPNNYNQAEYRLTYGALLGTLRAIQGKLSGEQMAKVHVLMRMSFKLGRLYLLMEQEAFEHGQA